MSASFSTRLLFRLHLKWILQFKQENNEELKNFLFTIYIANSKKQFLFHLHETSHSTSIIISCATKFNNWQIATVILVLWRQRKTSFSGKAMAHHLFSIAINHGLNVRSHWFIVFSLDINISLIEIFVLFLCVSVFIV